MLNELKLYGVIGDDVTGQTVKTQLAQMDQTQPLLVRIDSEGGSVFDGLSIYEALAAYEGPKKAIIEPTAFSIASYISAAFDEVEIVGNGYMMIHNPWMEASGDATQFDRQAQLLNKLQESMVTAYARKSGMSPEQVKELMAKETFFNAEESVRYGFATRVINTESKTRLKPKSHHKNMPQRVFASLFGGDSDAGDNREPTKEQSMSTATNPVATVSDIKAAFPKAKAEFIVRCLEKQLPLASVAAAAAEEMMAENEKLMAENESYKAKIAAMEEEMAKAKVASEEDPAAMDDEEIDDEEDALAAKAKAKAKGAKPVARASSSGPVVSAAAKWKLAVQAELKPGVDRAKAILAANKKNPGLREQMLAEANSK